MSRLAMLFPESFGRATDPSALTARTITRLYPATSCVSADYGSTHRSFHLERKEPNSLDALVHEVYPARPTECRERSWQRTVLRKAPRALEMGSYIAAFTAALVA